MRTNFFQVITLAILCGAATLAGCSPAGPAAAPNAPAQGAGQAQKTDGTTGQPAAVPIDASTPDKAVVAFLEAVRYGDEQRAASMLTSKAQTEMKGANMYVQPPGSPSAQFTIGQVKMMPEHGGAHVESTWTDGAAGPQSRNYDITWIMRQEGQSWRVAGMATRLFEDLPPLILNFENPADMKAQVQQAEAELARRNQPVDDGSIRQAAQPELQDGALR
jgi:hypothetical protein